LYEDDPQPNIERRELATRTFHSEQRDQPGSPSLSAQRKHSSSVYTLTSYKGFINDSETDVNGLFKSKNVANYSERFNESCAPTLVGSLESRQDNDRRRIQDLESRGIVINDICSVSNEPEFFSVGKKAPETGTKPIVWHYLVDDWGVESHSLDDRRGTERNSPTAIAAPRSPSIVEEDIRQAIRNDATIKSPVSSSYSM
jgi:hypothetical protein